MLANVVRAIIRWSNVVAKDAFCFKSRKKHYGKHDAKRRSASVGGRYAG